MRRQTRGGIINNARRAHRSSCAEVVNPAKRSPYIYKAVLMAEAKNEKMGKGLRAIGNKNNESGKNTKQ